MTKEQLFIWLAKFIRNRWPKLACDTLHDSRLHFSLVKKFKPTSKDSFEGGNDPIGAFYLLLELIDKKSIDVSHSPHSNLMNNVLCLSFYWEHAVLCRTFSTIIRNGIILSTLGVHRDCTWMALKNSFQSSRISFLVPLIMKLFF